MSSMNGQVRSAAKTTEPRHGLQHLHLASQALDLSTANCDLTTQLLDRNVSIAYFTVEALVLDLVIMCLSQSHLVRMNAKPNPPCHAGKKSSIKDCSKVRFFDAIDPINYVA